MNKIAILGSSGFVGKFVTNAFRKEKYLLEEAKIDITNKAQVEKWIENSQSEIIINFVAYTNVDQAEIDRDEAYLVNVKGAKNLAEIAKKHKKFLIHISSDFVFPGNKENPGPYKEDQKITKELENRIGWYGYTKLQGEKNILKITINYAIVRISFPFGEVSNEKDYISKTKKAIHAGYPLFTDQIITPTYLPDLVKALKVIANKKLIGTYHVASYPATTPYKFASLIVDKKLPKGSMENYLKSNDVARRPVWGGLDTSFTQKALNLKFSSLKSALKSTI